MTALDRQARLKVAVAARVDLGAVNATAQLFESVCELHKWLRERQARELPLPSSTEQWRAMVSDSFENKKYYLGV